MERYQRVQKPRSEEPINENEIRITAQGLIRNYISYATSLLQEKRANEIVLKAMGQAISKTVAIAEIIKKRISGLHQETLISSTSIVDAYEPIEEGLQPLEMTRQVSLIAITLSTSELNKNSPGYQAPPNEETEAGNQQPRQTLVPSTNTNQDLYDGWDQGRGQGRGRGRDRGRGRGRGRGRNVYGNYQGEDGGYYNYDYGRGNGRGRSWGNRSMGYERGKSGFRGSGRGYGRGRERMSSRGRDDGNQVWGRGHIEDRGRGGGNQA